MDLRDFDFWTREARKAALLRRADLYVAARLGMVKHDRFDEEMTRIEYQLRNIEEGN